MTYHNLLNNDHPFISPSKALLPICDPLRYFNIHLFTYLKKFKDGSQINVSTEAQWIEDYYSLGLYKTSTYEAELHEEGMSLWPWESDSRVFQHGRQRFNSTYGFTLCQQQHDGWEFYFFSLAANQFNKLELCLNHIDLIEEFTGYFKDKAAKLLKKCTKQKIILPKTKPLEAQILEPFPEIRAQFSQIIKGHTLAKWLNHYEPLTKREMECLYLLMDYQTITALADQLRISKRTIETHVERIKAKLHCRSKQELLIKLNQFKI